MTYAPTLVSWKLRSSYPAACKLKMEEVSLLVLQTYVLMNSAFLSSSLFNRLFVWERNSFPSSHRRTGVRKRVALHKGASCETCLTHSSPQSGTLHSRHYPCNVPPLGRTSLEVSA
ncbi:hypothetical protein TNCV_648981 [Trichonephila clavipes]|nr:hypothetical protein TNCV_648981 [Trichonephila clavipes]